MHTCRRNSWQEYQYITDFFLPEETLFFFYKGRNGRKDKPECFLHFCLLSCIWFLLLIPQSKAPVWNSIRVVHRIKALLVWDKDNIWKKTFYFVLQPLKWRLKTIVFLSHLQPCVVFFWANGKALCSAKVTYLLRSFSYSCTLFENTNSKLCPPKG